MCVNAYWCILRMNDFSFSSNGASAERAKGPEVVLGTKNPYPQMPSLAQKFFFSDADADINKNQNELVPSDGEKLVESNENASHFEYGKGNRLGTQAAYLEIPHRVQRSCIPMKFPHSRREMYGDGPFEVKGSYLKRNDIAFTMRLDRNNKAIQHFLANGGGSGDRRKYGAFFPPSPSADWMMNLSMVNYLLFGLQYYGPSEPQWKRSVWDAFSLDDDEEFAAMYPYDDDDDVAERMCTKVIRDYIKPFGVVTANEEEKERVGTTDMLSMIVDGRVENLRNYWKTNGLYGSGNEHAGEDEENYVQDGENLILILRKVDVFAEGDESCAHFHLPSALQDAHHHHPMASMRFPRIPNIGTMMHDNGKAWQLVPAISGMWNRECWERLGYWHIGQARGTYACLSSDALQQRVQGVGAGGKGVYGLNERGFSAVEALQNSSPLIECTFSPTWVDESTGGFVVMMTTAAAARTTARAPGGNDADGGDDGDDSYGEIDGTKRQRREYSHTELMFNLMATLDEEVPRYWAKTKREWENAVLRSDGMRTMPDEDDELFWDGLHERLDDIVQMIKGVEGHYSGSGEMSAAGNARDAILSDIAMLEEYERNMVIAVQNHAEHLKDKSERHEMDGERWWASILDTIADEAHRHILNTAAVTGAGIGNDSGSLRKGGNVKVSATMKHMVSTVIPALVHHVLNLLKKHVGAAAGKEGDEMNDQVLQQQLPPLHLQWANIDDLEEDWNELIKGVHELYMVGVCVTKGIVNMKRAINDARELVLGNREEEALEESEEQRGVLWETLVETIRRLGKEKH